MADAAKNAGAAFDEFVSGFRTPPRERQTRPALTGGARPLEGVSGLASVLDAPIADSPKSAIPAPVAEAATSTEPLAPSGVPGPCRPSSLSRRFVSVLVKAGTLPAEHRKRRARLGAVAGGLVVLAAAGALLIRSWQATPPGSGVQARPVPPPAAPAPFPLFRRQHRGQARWI